MNAPSNDQVRQWVEAAYGRLCALAAVMLRKDFARLRSHPPCSIANRAVVKLLAYRQGESINDFYAFAATLMRRTLLDLVRYDARRRARAVLPEVAADTHDPARLALWTEFHQMVERLPKEERQVFDRVYYHGLSQATVADLLQLDARKVSRLYASALSKLPPSPR